MSDYIVTARKWRPMKFDDVAAQNHVTQTLKNAVRQNRLAHAYLFAGPRGVGKTTTARLLAKLVNCLHPTADFEPDNECEMCVEITEGRSFDVLEIDGASNRGVDEIRNLRESVRYTPAKGKYKIYIIDEVHMLTKDAFNALLKTLEEPPPRVLFIFATTEIHKLPATVISRCQRFDFSRIAIDEIIKNLKGISLQEELEVDDDALLLIAKKGDGSMRDAQSIFDQLVALCGRTITKEQILQALNIVDQDFYFRVTDLVKARDAKGGIDLVQEIMSRGYDIKEFLSGLTEHLRNALTAITTGTTSLIEESDFYKKKYVETAKLFSVADILRLLKLVNGTEASLRWSAQPRFKLETDLVQMIMMNSSVEVSEVLQKIEELSKGLMTSRLRPDGSVDPSGVIDLAEKKKLPGASLTSPAQAPAESFTIAGTRAPVVSATVSAPGKFTRPSFTRPLPSSATTPSHAPAGAAKQNTLSEAEVISRWPEFIAEVRRQRIAVGTALESATVNGVTGSVIRVSANEFTASSLSRNRELLSEIVQKVFNAPGRIDVDISSNTKSLATPRNKPDVSPVSEEEHPIIKAMIRELGAEPL